MENITIEKVLSIFKRNIKFIIFLSIVGFAVGLIYVLTVFKPMYQSTAKILIKDVSQPGIITQMGTVNSLSPLARNSNPALTQMEILTSGILSDKVWQEISSKYKFKDDPRIGSQLMRKSIKVQNPVGTDIIEVTASWQDPVIAKDIANCFVTAYMNSNIDNSKKSIVQSKGSIDSQLNDAESNLAAIREKIKYFRQTNSTVDIASETQNVVAQISTLENRYSDILSSARSEANKVNTLSAQIGMDVKKAIDGVAIGHNPNLLALENRLGDAQEELASLSTKYAPTHPAFVALNSRINQIKTEFAEQIKETIGKNIDDNELVISDPVRTSIMQDLVNSEAAYRGFLAQSKVLKSAINSLESKKSMMPNKQFILANLTQQEASWTNIVDTLKAHQVEANIMESEIVSNISLIDAPRTPMFPAFPSRSQVILLFTLFGFLLSLASSLMIYLVKDSYDDLDNLSDELQTPILGVIPWLDKQTYSDPESLIAIDETASYYSLAYQNIISSFRVKGCNSGIKTLTFTSTEFSKSRSTILMNIAYGLSKAGQSVIVVDADFRTPSVHKEFRLFTDDKFNLGELLSNIKKEVEENGEFNWKYLSYFTHEVPEARNLFILPNNSNISDPYEYLHSASFNLLMHKLKEQYDWILLDTPPALAVSDAVTVGSYTDSVVLITGLDTTKSTIKKVHRLFNNYHLPIFGIVARERQTQEASSSNRYLKQMISRMMPEEDVLIQK
ncbi:MAG: exopolysaccharide transport family protein [Candidatus Gastranaerophilales bacterium]|nr:exopolysaccharide transport family protein [Candidatus Gastranaerophilales bacterium]